VKELTDIAGNHANKVDRLIRGYEKNGGVLFPAT
jgi:hypothetical protein